MKTVKTVIKQSEKEILKKLDELLKLRSGARVLNDIIENLENLGIEKNIIDDGKPRLFTKLISCEKFDKLEKFANENNMTKTEVIKQGILKLK